jgi:hypothetical protein
VFSGLFSSLLVPLEITYLVWKITTISQWSHFRKSQLLLFLLTPLYEMARARGGFLDWGVVLLLEEQDPFSV